MDFEKNARQDKTVTENCIVGSLDVDALYPSLDIERCARVVGQKLYDSDLTFPLLDWREISLYLVFYLTEEEIGLRRLTGCLPRRRTNRETTYIHIKW